MSRKIWERMIWGAAATLFVLISRQMIRTSEGAAGVSFNDGRVMEHTHATPTLAMFDSDSLDSAATNVIAHDAFRLERKPATVAYSMTASGVAPPSSVSPVLRIALQGTIGGPPWRAIISGVPGHDGTTIVSAGDTLGGIAVRRVSRDSVTVRVKDSTWTVTLSKAGA